VASGRRSCLPPDSYYRYQQAWHGTRLDALHLVEALARGLPRLLVGQPFDFHGAFENGQLLRRLADRLNRNPDPPSQTPEHIKKALGESTRTWLGAFQNFYTQLIRYVQDRSDEQAGNLTIFNFREASEIFPTMHETFSRLLELAPDYFGGRDLDARERKVYPRLGELLEVWIEDPPKVPYRDITQYMRRRRQRERDKRLSRLRDAAEALHKVGVDVLLPNDVHFRHPFRQVALAFAVKDPCHPENELEHMVEAFVPIRDTADFARLPAPPPRADSGPTSLNSYP
jgi:hypothetical protein